MAKEPSAILLISCPDRRGLVATITDFIFRRSGNILHLDQHVDSQQNIFFMRVEWTLENFETPRENISAHFAPIAEQYTMQRRLHFSDVRQRMALFISKQDHCLYDILSRWQAGDLDLEIPLMISNHANLEPVAKNFGIEYHTFKIIKDTKAEQEQAQLRLLSEHKVDFVVLARYMQILSADFTAHFPNRIINIHHSFLPAFPGAKPYHQAFERGVKSLAQPATLLRLIWMRDRSLSKTLRGSITVILCKKWYERAKIWKRPCYHALSGTI